MLATAPGRVQGGFHKRQIKDLWDIHHEIIRRLVIGQRSKDIADILRISEATVNSVKGSVLARRQMDLMRAARDKEAIDISQQIQDLCPSAVKVLEEAMDPEHPIHIRANMALKVLEMGGHKAPAKVQVSAVHSILSASDIDEIRKRRELALAERSALNASTIEVGQ